MSIKVNSKKAPKIDTLFWGPRNFEDILASEKVEVFKGIYMGPLKSKNFLNNFKSSEIVQKKLKIELEEKGNGIVKIGVKTPTYFYDFKIGVFENKLYYSIFEKGIRLEFSSFQIFISFNGCVYLKVNGEATPWVSVPRNQEIFYSFYYEERDRILSIPK